MRVGHHARAFFALATVLSWILWHDVDIYQAAGPTRLGGQVYAAAGHETEALCNVARRTALANEQAAHRGTLMVLLSDGIAVWDDSRQHYTTYRYRCAPVQDR
jgi:hypothetical protein